MFFSFSTVPQRKSPKQAGIIRLEVGLPTENRSNKSRLCLQNMVYDVFMTDKSQKKKVTANGACLAKLRKTAGFSQVQLAALIDIPQRTLSFYETYAENIPSTLVPVLANTLGVTVHEILGIKTPGTSKRGPKTKLERQFEIVQRLPRKDREFISKFLDTVIDQAAK